MSKIDLYLQTAAHLQPRQIITRLWRKLGGRTMVEGYRAGSLRSCDASLATIPLIPELDFDPVFLSRFDVDEISAGVITLLHTRGMVNWMEDDWRTNGRSPLWVFNLHYCEYLHAFAYQPRAIVGDAHIEIGKRIILSWIRSNPQEKGGPGWNPYTIALRVCNWIFFCRECCSEEVDYGFLSTVNDSLVEQGEYLACHLETDIVANHLLEELKSLMLLACYFQCDELFNCASAAFFKQVEEQVLPDGCHYERSPMYQKIILEDLLRIAVVLNHLHRDHQALDCVIAKMLSFSASIESGFGRTPLFNDAGDNVAKDLRALLLCAKNHLEIYPQLRSSFDDGGYELLDALCGQNQVRINFKVGVCNPTFAMAHMHCDSLSFELSINGRPILVNAGTYAYQGPWRKWFRESAASNVPVVDGCMQHQCWDQFRVARYGSGELVSRTNDAVSASFRDYKGHCFSRSIHLSDSGIEILTKTDEASPLCCYFHFDAGIELVQLGPVSFEVRGPVKFTLSAQGKDVDVIVLDTPRAPDFGLLDRGKTLEINTRGSSGLLLRV